MLRNNIGLVWRKMYKSKQCQFEDITIIHSTTASHALHHPCLVSLLFMASIIPNWIFIAIAKTQSTHIRTFSRGVFTKAL